MWAPLLLPLSAPIRVTLSPHQSEPALGRVRVYLAQSCHPPPMSQCSDEQETAQAFGVDTPASGLHPGASVTVTATTTGYPRHSLADVPAGRFCIQADLLPYTAYHRGDGVNVTLPTSCVSAGGGDGQYGSPPGTMLSEARWVDYDPSSSRPLDIVLSRRVPSPDPKSLPGCSGKGGDTEYIKTVRVPSPLLSHFWGTAISLEACVLLPWGFEAHPKARYPLLIAHGHYSEDFEPGGRFDPAPPSPNMTGYEFVDQLYAHWFYTNWTSATAAFHGARALVITIKVSVQHAPAAPLTPYNPL